MVIFEKVSKFYTEKTKAVNNLNLVIDRGKITVLIGPSGCGKTTTLKMINRLITPTAGKIYINGIDTDKLNPVDLRRQIGYVIQDIALFPHKTVAANISVVLKLKKWEHNQIKNRVDELLRMVDMDPDIYRNRYPKELSGGQQQRIGVLRALAAEPELLLMDEPFGSLDPITRNQLQDELKHLQKKLQKTIIFVTHDMDEALKIADKIIIMREGSVVQEGTPEEILQNTDDEFVRSFIGEERLIRRPEQVLVSEIMVKNPVKIEYNRSLRLGLEIMRERIVDNLLIIDYNNTYLGTVTVRDIQTNLKNKILLSEIISERPTVNENDNVKEAVKFLINNGLQFVPVIDNSGKLKGIVTRSSIVNFVLDYM